VWKYKTIDTRTVEGLKQAERLHEEGWTVGSVGFWTIQFYKEVPSKPAPDNFGGHKRSQGGRHE
jgi:hypothetical protein